MSSGRKISTTLRVGSRVEYTVVGGGERKKVPGTVAYGPGAFHLKPNENDWCGVILDEPLGKNNGTVQGKQYFECAENCGVFVRVSTLRPIIDQNRAPTTRRSTPSNTPKSMTPSSSIQSFTGMFDSGSSTSNEKPTNVKPVESTTTDRSKVSKLRPPTKILSSSNQDVSGAQQQLSNIRQMVEKLEIKRDEMIRDDDATQDISQIGDTSQSNTPTHKSKEIQELNEKNKDLESKLQTLMLKRAEDRIKFKEFERLKIQNEQLLENKKQMAEKIAELSKQKSVAEKEAQDAREEQVRQAEEIKDLVDNAEMAVIDKEMAENKAEQLQLELEQCREQLEEAKLDFEILKTEIEDKGVDGAANSFQVKKLEDQNVRLKEALLKLRDISATDRNNLQLMQKDIERKNEEINNMMQNNEKNEKELNKCYEQIEDLKEQVDMALGSQEMVEKLTEKNLAMEDKIEELQKALDEEENIKELSNMIIEEKDEIIADLRDEVDRYKTSLVNLRNNHMVLQEAVQDHERTIKKFRELVLMLKEENTMLRAAQEQDSSKVQQAVDVQKQLENIEFKNRLLDRKDLSRAIDMELRQLDIDQCYKHMVFLARFFPESFFVRGGDHDCIAVLLFIPRMFTKCLIIERQIIEKYSSGLMSDAETTAITPESIVREVFIEDSNNQIQVESIDKLKRQIFIKHIVYLLTSIRSTLDKYQDILTRCDSELFMKLGSLYPELSAHEKNVDHLIDLLREDKLDETVPLDSLEKILSYLQSLYNIYMASNNYVETMPLNDNHNKFLNDLLDVLRTGTEASILDLKVLSRMLTTDASMFVSTMETSLNDIEQFGRKIRRRMVSAGSASSDLNPACLIRLTPTVEAELLDSFHNFSLTVRSIKMVRSVMMQQYLDQFIKNSDSNSDQKDGDLVKKFTMDDIERTCKEWTGNSIKSLNEMLTNVMSAISKFCTVFQQGDYDVSKNESMTSTGESLPSTTGPLHFSLPQSFQSLFSSNNSQRRSGQTLQCIPLDQRAMVWRAQSEQINDFRQKILTQESDIAELKRALKVKIDELSEMQIRRDLSDKKHKETLKEVQKLQDELDRMSEEFKEKEAERERTLNKYNQEINDLYSDRRMMKEKLKDYSKSALLGKMMLNNSASSPLSNVASSPIQMSNLSMTSIHPSPSSLSPNSSLNQSLLSTTVHSATQPSMVATSNDVVELQQQIHNLRSAMKRLAARNNELKIMLTAHQETIQLKDGQIVKIRPKWYLDSLRRIQHRLDHIGEIKFQEFRSKLLKLKQDMIKYRCSDPQTMLSELDQLTEERQKPGWSRCIGDWIKRNQQQQYLCELDFKVRFRQLSAEFEQFVKTLDDGFSCDSTFVSFIAPHVSKILTSQPKLMARIKVNGNKGVDETSCSRSVLPIEVTNDELKQIQSMLLSY